MDAYLSLLGYDVWRATKDYYTKISHPITNPNARMAHENNAKENNFIIKF